MGGWSDYRVGVLRTSDPEVRSCEPAGFGRELGLSSLDQTPIAWRRRHRLTISIIGQVPLCLSGAFSSYAFAISPTPPTSTLGGVTCSSRSTRAILVTTVR